MPCGFIPSLLNPYRDESSGAPTCGGARRGLLMSWTKRVALRGMHFCLRLLRNAKNQESPKIRPARVRLHDS